MFDPNPWNALFVFRALQMQADERPVAPRDHKRRWHLKRRLMRLYVRANRSLIAHTQSAPREHAPRHCSDPIIVR
jgi:hypothetical protein